MTTAVAVATRQPVNTDEKPIQFTPLGGADDIKLSVIIIQNLLAVKTKRGHTCSRAEATKFLMMCQARRLNPFEGDAFLVGYDTEDGPTFSIVTAHQAFLKRAELATTYRGMDSGIIVREEVPELAKDQTPEPVDGNRMDPGLILRLGQHQWRLQRGDFYVDGQLPVGGWATVQVEGKKIPTHRRLRLERFNKGFAEWKKDPAGMICKCAEADALRSSFPTHCGGMHMAGETQPASERERERAEIADMTQTAKGLVEVVNGGGQPPPAAADEKAESEAGLAPERATTPAAPAGERKSDITPQAQLANILGQHGLNFTQFQRWTIDNGTLDKADSIASFDEIGTGDARRLCKIFRGSTMKAALEQLQQIKAGGVS